MTDTEIAKGALPGQTTQTIKVFRACPSEYVGVGETYTVTRSECGRGANSDAHFYNIATGSGTYMREYRVEELLKSGHMQIVEG